jgi:type IV pilus assembly protein PilV
MTLIEVLIAAVVLAIGLLGVAALQVSAMQGASEAQFRSKAIDLTSILADRVRANLSALEDYTTLALTCEGTARPADEICSMDADDTTNEAADCSPAQMAAYDLWYVRCRAEEDLPGGQLTTAQVPTAECPDCCAALTPLQITISWQTQGENNDDVTDDVVTDEVVTTIIPGAQIYVPGEPHACI